MGSKQASLVNAPKLWRLDAFAGDLGLTPEASEQLKQIGLELSDVLSVIESPLDIGLQRKEFGDGEVILIGENEDRQAIEILVLLEPGNGVSLLGVWRR